MIYMIPEISRYKNGFPRGLKSRRTLNIMNFSRINFTFAIVIVLILAVCKAQEDELKRRNQRIMGGISENVENYPSIVFILGGSRDGFQNLCGGSIIDHSWIVTAAHCIDGLDFYIVKAGTNNFRADDGGTTHSIKNVIIHENFNDTVVKSDIALLRVDPPFVWDETHQPIKMMETDEDIKPNTTAIVVGYGLSKSAANHIRFDGKLRSLSIPILDREKCSQSCEKDECDYKDPEYICAGYAGNTTEAQRDACSGDSGGPLIVDGRLAAIISWGTACIDNVRHPGLYVKISVYRRWIDLKINPPVSHFYNFFYDLFQN